MAPASRNCCLNLAWRYIALVLIAGSLIAAPIPLGFNSSYVQGDAFFVCVIASGWWFLGLFWNTFVIAWESIRKVPMHPGAVVGMDLIITLYGLGGPCLWGIWMTNDVNFQYFWAMRFTNVTRIPKEDRDHTLVCFAIFSALAVFATAIHLVLCIIGCVHEDRRRKAIKKLLADKSGHGAVPADASYGHESYRQIPETAGRSSPPRYTDGINSAVAAKQAEIERMEREFGNGKARDSK